MDCTAVPRRVRRFFIPVVVCSALVVSMVAFVGPSASAEEAAGSVLTYRDEVSGATVHRLTSDGPDGCINYMGNTSGEATSWSPDSSSITYAKHCANDTGRTGIYVFDLATGTERCLTRAAKHWAYPIFDHDGANVYFIGGSDEARDGGGSKPYAVYRVDADRSDCGARDDVTTRVLDLRAAAAAEGHGVENVLVLTRNAGTDLGSQRFATHVRSAGRWRTVVFDHAGRFEAGWGFGSDNATHDDLNDGDASVWSPHDPRMIYTNRAGGPTDPSVRRGLWLIDGPRLQHVPESCGGSNSVAHSDWAYHPATGTNVIVGGHRCVWSVDAQGRTATTDWRLHGYIHVDVDPSSLGGSLGEIRFVADEYFDGHGSNPYLYVTTLADVGIDGGGYPGWSGVRENDAVVGHRNRMDTGTNDGLKAFEPHPQFSPDGRHLLWQSNSLNAVNDHRCPVATCGPAGGDDGQTSFLDVYVVELDGGDQPPPPPVEPVELSGRVTTDAGAAAPDVVVDLFVGTESGERRSYVRSVTTGADGTYRLTGLDTGCHVVTMIAPDGTRFVDGGRWSQHARCLDPGETAGGIDAVVRDGRERTAGAEVRITDGGGGPVEGVVVDLFLAGGDGSRAAYVGSEPTEADGASTFATYPGCYVVVAIAPDGERFDNGTGYAEHRLCVADGEVAAVAASLTG